MHPRTALLLLALLVFAAACAGQPTRFAVVGDFGSAGQPEADVAALIKSWSPEFVITLGDNNYENGAAAAIDANIGQYYHEFISPYTGAYGAGDSVNRFFPALGNHDWVAAGALPYLAYFTLPGNERYYDFVRGPVHLFAIDVDPHEPDGIDSSSVQAQWLKAQLAASSAKWKIVYMHHAPFSSCSRHGSHPILQWPYERWGASAVLAGHDHTYERISVAGIPYFVNGLGGRSIYAFTTPVAGSQVRYNADYGAMLIEADLDSLVFSFTARSGALIDRHPVHDTDTAALACAPDWNLLSLPMELGRRRLDELLPGAASKAFRIEAGHYQTTDTVEAGYGYWVKFPAEAAFTIAGDTLTSKTVGLAEGWNIVGALTFPLAAASVATDPPGILVTPFFDYAGSYAAADTLRPGKGYWVRAASSGDLILTLPSELARPQR